MLMRRNVAAGIGSSEQGEYCRAALQRSDRKEPRYKSPTLLYFTFRAPLSLVSEDLTVDGNFLANLLTARYSSEQCQTTSARTDCWQF